MARVLMVAVVAVLLAGGCADHAPRCDTARRPQPAEIVGERRPVEVGLLQAPPVLEESLLRAADPVVGSEAPATEQVLHHLRWETMKMAGATAKMDVGRCDGGDVKGTVGATTRCTVVFEGVEVPWLVQITRNDPPIPGLVYTATPLASVHTAQAVYDAFGWEAGQRTDGRYREPRCDRLPKAFAAKLGTDTGYFCQDVALSCTNGGYEFRWSDRVVAVDGRGRVVFR